MKAWVVRKWCNPEEMELAELPVPTPGHGQALVRVDAAALNFLDTLMIQGLYQVKPPLPFTPGIEVSGTVVKPGNGSSFREGERVMGNVGYGAFAQYAVIDDLKALSMPDNMTAVEGATFPCVYPTSYSALRHGARMQPGETVLVHAGAGGVGLAAIQLAKAWGGTVIATAGGQGKGAICRQHGADFVIDYLSEPWVDKVKEYSGGRGADIIVDPVGGDITDLSLKCLAWCGRLLIIGFAGGRIPQIPANRLLLKSASAIGVFWGEQRNRNPESAREMVSELLTMYGRGEITPVISKVYPLADAPRALLDLASRQTYGKVVLTT